MLFGKRFWGGLADGSITLAFRRWKRATVKSGGTLQSPVGQLAIESVERTSLKAISADDARRSGFESKAALLRELAKREGHLYRVELRFVGGDPRDALREDDALSAEDVATLRVKLDRSDERSAAPWSRQTIALVAANPGRRAGDLAPRMGMELRDFKANVRKLKKLGLTESLKVGYRLSPRGEALVEALRIPIGQPIE